jgi:hypothetical protein
MPGKNYMTANTNNIKTIMKTIVDLLVHEKYQDIENITGGNRLSSSDIKHAIQEYGHNVIAPPLSAFDSMDCVSIQGTPFSSWSVRMNLWTSDEGKSDLSIDATISEQDDGISLILEDIHVL